jgi:hypothetical protein
MRCSRSPNAMIRYKITEATLRKMIERESPG